MRLMSVLLTVCCWFVRLKTSPLTPSSIGPPISHIEPFPKGLNVASRAKFTWYEVSRREEPRGV